MLRTRLLSGCSERFSVQSMAVAKSTEMWLRSRAWSANTLLLYSPSIQSSHSLRFKRQQRYHNCLLRALGGTMPVDRCPNCVKLSKLANLLPVGTATLWEVSHLTSNYTVVMYRDRLSASSLLHIQWRNRVWEMQQRLLMLRLFLHGGKTFNYGIYIGYSGILLQVTGTAVKQKK